MANHAYFAPCFKEPFKSLEDAKWNVKIAFTRTEAIRNFYGYNEEIAHFVDHKLYSVTPVNVDESGNISFGKTRRV